MTRDDAKPLQEYCNQKWEPCDDHYTLKRNDDHQCSFRIPFVSARSLCIHGTKVQASLDHFDNVNIQCQDNNDLDHREYHYDFSVGITKNLIGHKADRYNPSCNGSNSVCLYTVPSQW